MVCHREQGKVALWEAIARSEGPVFREPKEGRGHRRMGEKRLSGPMQERKLSKTREEPAAITTFRVGKKELITILRGKRSL